MQFPWKKEEHTEWVHSCICCIAEYIPDKRNFHFDQASMTIKSSASVTCLMISFGSKPFKHFFLLHYPGPFLPITRELVQTSMWPLAPYLCVTMLGQSTHSVVGMLLKAILTWNDYSWKLLKTTLRYPIKPRLNVSPNQIPLSQISRRTMGIPGPPDKWVNRVKDCWNKDSHQP